MSLDFRIVYIFIHIYPENLRGRPAPGRREFEGMYFYNRLYISPLIRDSEKVKENLRREVTQVSIFVIMLIEDPAKRGGDQLEFCHSINLRQPWYREHPPYIIGIARGYQDSVEMIRQIVQECYDHTGNCNVRDYLFPGGLKFFSDAGSGKESE